MCKRVSLFIFLQGKLLLTVTVSQLTLAFLANVAHTIVPTTSNVKAFTLNDAV